MVVDARALDADGSGQIAKAQGVVAIALHRQTGSGHDGFARVDFGCGAHGLATITDLLIDQYTFISLFSGGDHGTWKFSTYR
jgi:hypothetical protein